jgi:hypothetical protein
MAAEVKEQTKKIEVEKVEASITGIITIVTLIGSIIPYIMKILEAFGGVKDDVK